MMGALTRPATPDRVEEGPSAEGSREGKGPRDAALRALVEGHFDFVWRVLCRLGVPHADADDTTQQVFMIAAEKIETVDLARAKPFLFGIAMRVAANARRTISRRREISAEGLASLEQEAPSPEDVLDKRQGLELLDRTLMEVPGDLRAVLILMAIEGMTKSEAAISLGIPEGTVASRLRRARQEFREALERRMRVQSRERGTP